MNTIRLAMIAAVIACSGGCSTLPTSMEVGRDDVQKIAWTKGSDAKAFRDEHGVCHMFSRDTRSSLQDLGEQVKACFNGSLQQKVLDRPQVKSVTTAWNKVPRAQMAGVYAQATGQGKIKGKGGSWKSADRLFAVRGFFQYHGNTCHVVVPDQADYVSTLGHEFKHCVDGYFHNHHGEWHNESPARAEAPRVGVPDA